MNNTKKQIEILVIGGGFAGIKVVRELKNRPNIHLTLVSDADDFRYYPALYRTATGHLKRDSDMPVREMIQGIKNVNFVKAKAKKIDRKVKKVTCEDGSEYRYDYAVIAIGVVTSYFGIEGLEKYSYGIKSPTEVDHLKSHLHQELIGDHKMDKNYVVVGAGPTGVELAASLQSYLTDLAARHNIHPGKVNIELIEAAPRVLPVMSERASALVHRRLESIGVKVWVGKKVEGETEKSLVVDGRSLPTHTVIWTAGVTNNPFFADNSEQFEFNKRHKVIVDDHLRVDDHTFVVGDNAATPYSGLAMTAVHDAKYVARQLEQKIYGTSDFRPYTTLKPTSIIPVGSRWAIVQKGRVVFGGYIGSLLRSAADFIGYSDVLGYRGAWQAMRQAKAYEETCPVCER